MSASNTPKQTDVPPAIEHVVVLMLENRSFDSLLGALYPSTSGFEGLSGNESNVFAGRALPLWKSDPLTAASATIPDPDPGESFADMTAQLFAGRATVSPPPMSGFVANYMAQAQTDCPRDPEAVLHYFAPEQIPVLSTLAKAFGVCDQWFASAPCQTWPNRFFAHTGTALGHVNNDTFRIPFSAPSIFDRLERNGNTWRVYFHDVPQSILLGDVWLLAPLHYRGFSQFLADAAAGVLPNYSFIEPRYFADPLGRALPNDQHPPHNVLEGETLIAAVYNAVRRSPCWKKSLLIVTYDEHGGCYDHVPPPRAVSPDAQAQEGFAFDRFGVRVPAVIVSPYVPAGSVIRAADPLPHQGPPYPFDHTSILSTLRKLFGLGVPFSNRDAAAPDVLSALSLAVPSNDGPAMVSAHASRPSTADIVARAKAQPNAMQQTLARMAASLPPKPLAAVPLPAPMAARAPETVATACVDAVMRVSAFLGL